MTLVTDAAYGESNLHRVSNDAEGTPASDVAGSDTSFDMESGVGSDFPADNFVIFVPNTGEYIFVGSRSGDTLSSLTRDFDGDLGGGQAIADEDEVRLVKGETSMTQITDVLDELTNVLRGEEQKEVTVQLESADGSHSVTVEDSDGTTIFNVSSNGNWTDGTNTVYDAANTRIGSNLVDTTSIDESIAPTWTGTHDFSGGDLVFPTATGPTPTSEGQAVWDTDDDKLRIGDGAATVTLVDEGRTLTGGDGIQSIGDLSADRTIAAAPSDFTGSGLTTSGSPADIDVGSGTGITVNADDVAVDQSFSPTWTSSHTFNGGLTMGSTLTMNDGQNVSVGSTNGTQIATAATQMLGFFGATPVAQQTAPASLTDNSGGTTDNTVEAVSGSGADTAINNNFAELTEEIGQIRTVLVNLGLAA